MDILLHPTYFPNIAHFVVLLNADNITFETQDNYQKQTYRNRANIYGANGKLGLTIPVNFSQKNRQLYRDVRIHNEEKWQINHWKSLESAYKMSPFFEFYQDDLRILFEEKTNFLLDFNLKCFTVVCNCLDINFNFNKTVEFEKSPLNKLDLRNLVNTKKEVLQNFDSYTQVFTQKHGFISNLSILDLLFNEGPNAENYLRQQTLKL